MAVTNVVIIATEQQKLLEEGVLNYTGRVIMGVNPITGEKSEYKEIQPIHTYAKWKSLGYKVKKGEHAIAKFPIWKYSSKRRETETGEEVVNTRCFMKTAHFFTDIQVEKIEEDKNE